MYGPSLRTLNRILSTYEIISCRCFCCFCAMSSIKAARKQTNAQPRKPTPAPKKEASKPKKPTQPLGKVPPLNEKERFILASRGCNGIPPAVVESIESNKVGFGHQDLKDPTSIYCRMPGSTGNITTKSELGLTVTDFFDYNSFDAEAGGVAQEVTNYFWSVDQNLFENGTSTPFDDRERTFCRVRKIQVYVLPVKGFEIGTATGENNTNATGQFTVNCQTPGVSSVSSQAAIAMDTQVTNVLPQIDTFWKKVFSCDLQKTFQSGVVRPYFDTVVDNFAQCLFQMSIVDPTTGVNYIPGSTSAPDFSIRVKVVMHIDQPIATIQNAKLKVFRNESFITPSLAANGTDFSAPEEEYVQMNLRRKQDFMR